MRPILNAMSPRLHEAGPMSFTTKPHYQTQLVSRTSILIIGAFLLGTTGNEVVSHGASGLKYVAFLFAVFGMIAYIGLTAIHRRRCRQAQQLAEEAAAAKMDNRVQRTLQNSSSMSSSDLG